jgi:hypothetical protein
MKLGKHAPREPFVVTACGPASCQAPKTFLVWVMAAEEIKTQRTTQEFFAENEKYFVTS